MPENHDVPQDILDDAQKYRHLMKTIPDSVYCLDRNAKIVDISFAATEFYGFTEEDILGRDFSQFIHPDDREFVITSFLDAVETKREWTFGLRFRLVAKNGDTHWVETNAHMQFDENGQYEQENGVIRNIDAQKAFEDTLHETETYLRKEVRKRTADLEKANARLKRQVTDISNAREALTEREALLRNIINSMEDGILVLNRDFEYTYWSRGMEAISGIPASDLVRTGKKAWEHFPHLKDQGVDLMMKQAMTGETVTKENIPFELDTGRQGFLTKTFVPLKTLSGDILGVIGLVRDVTRILTADREMEDLKRQLSQAQKMEAIGTLASGIAHDFNNILFPVIGNTEMMIQDVGTDSPMQEPLRETLDGMLRARDLVRQILSFSRQLDAEIKPLAMQPVVKEALKLIRSSLPSYIQIRQSIDADCGAVRGTPSQIHQIVMNLCTNAFHAMMETGGVMTVDLAQINTREKGCNRDGLPEGEFCRFSVSDTGTGIEQALLGKIFNPYFTTKEDGKGTGLGLSVVHGIVMHLKGRIKVNSEPGRGTRVTVYLPVEKAAVPDLRDAAASDIRTGDEHILLVDDQATIIHVVRKILLRLGYQVTACRSGSESLEIFKDRPDRFDLVITDLTMPDLTGDVVAEHIARIRPDIPIIICTGYMGMIRPELKESPAIKAFLPKPVVISELSQTLRRILDGTSDKTADATPDGAVH